MGSIAVSGHVKAFLVSPCGHQAELVCGRNTVSYRCADAVAGMFAGLADARPVSVAFVYAATSGKETSFNFSPGERNKTQSDIVPSSSGLSVHEVDLDPNPRCTPSAATYQGNKVTFSATTRNNTAAEYVYGFLLKNAAGDVLAVKKADSALFKPAGYALSVTWDITFT